MAADQVQLMAGLGFNRFPTLALWGSEGFMHQYWDMAAVWRERCTDVRAETLPGAHFFVDQFPAGTAAIVADLLGL